MMNLVDEDTLDQDHLTITRCSITPWQGHLDVRIV